MSTTMTSSDRPAFLSQPRIGVLAVDATEPGHGPLAGAHLVSLLARVRVEVVTSRTSRKGVAIERAGSFSLLAQTESVPYRDIGVEGSVIRRCDDDQDLPLAVRYLGDGSRHGVRRTVAGRRHRRRPDLREQPARWLPADHTSTFSAIAPQPTRC